VSYHPPASGASIPYNSGHRNSGDSSFSEGEYRDDDRTYDGHYTPDRSPIQAFCPCRTNPATSHAYIALSNQLQSTLGSLRPYYQHSSSSPCAAYRRVVELNTLLAHSGSDHGSSSNPAGSYDTLPTPTDSEIMTPLSASSTPYNGPAASAGHSPQEWNAMTGTGYTSYFPMQSGEHVYNNGIP